MSRIYARQRAFFRKAYVTGVHGWPAEGTTPHVEAYLLEVRRRAGRVAALDLGCGEGRHSIAMARLGFETHAVDLEPLAVDKARAASRKAGVASRIRFAVGDALKLTYPDGAFGLVLDYGCFHHVTQRDWPKYFRNALRVLRPGGYLILSVFGSNFKHTADERRTRNFLVHRGHYDRFFTSGEIRRVLARHFKVLKISREVSGLQEFYHVLAKVPLR